MADAYQRLREYVAHAQNQNHTTASMRHIADIEILLREVGASREFGGNFSDAHRRMTSATQRASRLREEIRLLQETIDTMSQSQDLPLWRRIAGQRREIRALWATAEMYRRMWRKEVDQRVGS